MIVPSKLETFGQTATEAMACGTPVVAFNNTGLSDIVEHKKNGYLAELLDINDLAKEYCGLLIILIKKLLVLMLEKEQKIFSQKKQ